MSWWSYGKPLSRRKAMGAAGIAGAGSFAPAGGQVAQRPDQGSNPPQSVVSPTQAAGTLRARVVIISGPSAGVFLYSPSPGPGNLVASGTTGVTDPSGNKTLEQGWAVYSPGSGLASILTGNSWQGYTGSESGGWTFEGASIALHPNTIQLFTSSTGNGSFQIIGPSGDTTGATDLATINAQLAIEQAVVMLVPGTYYINGPIVMPDQTVLAGFDPSWGIPTGNYGNGSLPLQGAIITPSSSFSGAAAITFNPTGDALSQHGGQRLYGITIDGSSLPGGNTADGIKSTGYVAGVKMRDVTVFGAFGGTGLHLVTDGTASHVPDFWQLDSCKFSGCHTNGLDIISLADSWFVNCEATGNTGVGWKINNSAGTRMIGCRGNNNATGINWTGLSGFTANFLVDACEFASNTGTGVIVGGTGSGLITLDAVDANSNGTQYSYSGTNSVKSNAAWNTSTGAPTFL